VIGAAGGIGGATALALADAGAVVVAADRAEDTLAARVAEAEARGLDVRSEWVDDSEPDSEKEMVAAAVRGLAGVDVLVNAAAIQLRKPALEVSPEEWQRVIDTNLGGTFFSCQAVAPHLRGGGAIVNLASLTSQYAIDQIGVYGASKAGVAQVTRQLALELARDGIRVNAVAPGYIRTAMTETVLEDAQRRDWILERIPLGRIGEPEDVTGPILFLASDAARYITGHVLFVDGGWAAC
jgi:NAD(P)-dependent dehydrogenase (short-subunit alcohol dehydrogenase family)